MAGDPPEEGAVTAGLNADRWRTPIGLGLLVAVGGLFMIGLLGAVAGGLAGAAAARRPRLVLAGAGLALIVAAALTLLEEPLSETAISAFPPDHGLAEAAAAIAAVLVLGGLAGLVARRDLATAPRWPPVAEPEGGGGTMLGRLPNSTVAAVAAAVLLASVILLLPIGDQRWQPVGIAAAIAVLILAGVAVARNRRLSSGSS
jgi:disulfide bond formation protein DsbB